MEVTLKGEIPFERIEREFLFRSVLRILEKEREEVNQKISFYQSGLGKQRRQETEPRT